MTARPPVDMDAARAAVARHLTGQPALTRAAARTASASERRAPAVAPDVAGVVRSSGAPTIVAPAAVQAPRRTYGDVLAADPIEPFRVRNPLGERPPRARSAAAQLDTSRTSFSEKGQLATSCSITADDGTEPIAVYADDPGAHAFRREVARHLERLGWATRARNLASCGEAGARCDCGDCGTPHVLPYRCGARSCPTCAHSAAAIVCERVAKRIEIALASLRMDELWEGQERVYPRTGKLSERRVTRRRRCRWRTSAAREKRWKHVILTTRAPQSAAERFDLATMREYALEVRRAVGALWRSTPWGRRVHDVSPSGRPTKRARRDTLYVCGIEAGEGGMVHVHLAVYGEYVADWHLARLWKAACRYGGFVKIKGMRGSDAEGLRAALREVLKYVTKGDKQPGQRARRAAVIECAFRGIRRLEVGGAIRLVPNVTAKDVATASRECEACGGARSWRWRGVRAPDYVRRNRGFGISHVYDDADLEYIRADDRELEFRRSEPQREAWREADAEKRPGGRFYGGSPPPWIDDPDEWETVSDAPRPVEWWPRSGGRLENSHPSASVRARPVFVQRRGPTRRPSP